MRWVLVVVVAMLMAAACGGDDGTLADATYEAQRATNEARLALTPSPTATSTGAASPSSASGASPTRPASPTLPPGATRPAATETASPTATATATIEPTPQPASVSGGGSVLTDPVALSAGLAVITMRHDGFERFAVTLLDTAGATIAFLTNSGSPYLGSRGVQIPVDGDYAFEVVADGAWTIDINRPVPPESIISDLPFEQSGGGSQAVYFVRLPPGLHRVSATHDGAMTFTVTVIDSRATYRDRVIDVEGPFDGSGAISGTVEPYEYVLIDILADGQWTVRIE